MTLRQLLLMGEGHGRDEWSRMSVLLSMIANANRDPKKGRAARPKDFDPYAKADRRRRALEVTPETIEMFRDAFK